MIEDNASSHLKNALQVSTLLAAELPKMIGNPGYLSDATIALTAIDERIRAALELIEDQSRRCPAILNWAPNTARFHCERQEGHTGNHEESGIRWA